MSIESAARPSPYSRNVVHLPSFAGTGVTSIMPVPSTNGDYYVGTKRGNVKQIALPANLRGAASRTIRVRHMEDANGKTLKPYPVFSLASAANDDEGGSHDLLAGGGDRYVTVWRISKQENSQVNTHTLWKVQDQLGPHTGWVKDIACHPISPCCEDDGTFIFSIGCNCIEVWSLVGGKYNHQHKLRIESSVEMGSTLSSDLLCLAVYSERATTNDGGADTNYLLAGGVDGRIHRWTIHSNNFSNAGVISAHNGRVNAMAVCNKMGVMVSVGNDGCVRCSMMNERNPSGWDKTALNFVEGDGTARKISSLCILRDEPQGAIVAVGMTCGQTSVVKIHKTENNALQVSLLKDGNIIGLESGERSVIHALCGKRHNNCYRIIIGHSVGLSVWDLSLL